MGITNKLKNIKTQLNYKMQKKGNAGQMRLQRESRMQKKDMDAQVKKSGKINDGFICLPDPEDAYKWWYVIFGLDMDPYRGGYYMGYITCPEDYPAKAPKINLITHNGRFRVNEQQDGSASPSHTTIQSPGTQHGRSTRSSSVSKPSGKV